MFQKKWIVFITVLLLLMVGHPVSAQEILLDKFVQAGPLTCFQSYEDPLIYYYLPDNPRLATHESGKPQFSFLKYARNVERGKEGGISEAEGGGIVHFLVEYGATENDIKDAEGELRKEVPEAKIAGPIMYRSGHFTLVSSFKQKDGEFTKRIVGIGKAPLIEGHKAAVSMNLTREGAQVLWESFQTETPDISVLFEMEFAGYREPFEAHLEADWSMISKHKSFAAGVKYLWFGADIQATFDELRQSGAIKLTVKGENPNMDAMIASAYSKLQDIMFAKASTSAPAKIRQGDDHFNNLMKAIKVLSTTSRSRRSDYTPQHKIPGGKKILLAGDILHTDMGPILLAGADSKSGKTSGSKTSTSKSLKSTGSKSSKSRGKTSSASRKRSPRVSRSKASQTPGFSLIASYRMKKIKRSGKFEMDFNQYLETKQPVAMAENIGNLYAKYGNDPKVFRAVNMDDPVFKQREILVALDGQDSADFDKYVNFVTVQLRKKHENGKETVDEVVIRKKNFNSEGNSFRMLYGWKGDADRRKWMKYQYRTDWSFHNGMSYQGEWVDHDLAMISASPPYEYRKLTLEAEPKVFRDRRVRHATIKLYYQLFGKELIKQATIKTNQEIFSIPLEYIHSKGDLNYEYEISWHLKGGKKVSSPRQPGSSDILYCDEIP